MTRTTEPRATTPAETVGLTTLPVWSQTAPNAAGLFTPGLSRDYAYRAADRGDLPGARKIGGRWIVATAVLLDALGLSAEAGA